LKILHVIPPYEPAWAFGGPVVSTSSLCRELAKTGSDISVFTTDVDGNGGFLDVPLNTPVDLGGVTTWYFHCNFGKKGFLSLDLARKLSATINEYDLVHVSATWQWIQINVYETCSKHGIPYIVSPRGSYSPWSWSQKSIKKNLFWHLFSKKTIEQATALHFTAEGEREKALPQIKLPHAVSSFVVPNGFAIDKIRYEDGLREKLNIPHDRILLLSIGRIHRKKGIHFIIEAMKRLKDQRVILLILGNKEDSLYVDSLESQSRTMENQVIWHEQVGSDEVWDYYHAADVFVLPSYDENFGMAVAESMACGTPVLISRNVDIWQDIEADNAGFIVNQDPEEIAPLLKKIADNPGLLKEMGRNAKKAAEKRYNISNVATLMLKAYEDILTGKQSAECLWKN